MASALSNLFAVLSLDSQSFLDDLNKTKKKTDSFMASFANVGGAVAAGIGAAAAGGLFLLGESVKEAVAAEEVAAKLNATLANTGKVTGVTAQMVDDLANNFQSLTRFEDDTIKAGGEVLARFDEINKDVFPEALELSLDLATRLGIDVPDASMLLGKALADPGVGLMKLKAAGVVFNDETEKMIDTMMKSGDQAGAMALIMDTVRESVGGSAVAAGNTAGGMWERLRNIWGNILETIGTGLLPAITQLGQTLMEYLNRPEVQVFIAALAQSIADFAMNVVTHIPQVVMWFQNVFRFLQENEGIVIGIFVALGVAVTAWGVMTAAAAWTALAPLLPVIAVLLAIAAVVYLVYQAWTNNWGGIQEKTAAVLAWIREAVNSVMTWFSDFINGRLGIVSQVFAAAWQNIQLIFQAFKAAFQGDWYQFGAFLRQAFDNTWQTIVSVVGQAWENIKQAVMNGIAAVRSFFTNTDWGAVGRAIIEGIANGIIGGISAITNAARTAAQNALSAAKGFLGIKSPSQVFETEVGFQMAAGVARGWEDGLGNLMPRSLGGLQPQAVQAGGGGTGGGMVFNINVTSDGVTDERDVARRIASAVDVLLRERGLA